MAKTNSTPKEHLSPDLAAAAANQTYRERLLTVTKFCAPSTSCPWLQLRGLWLQQAGFKAGTKVRVRVMSNCLVILKE